jgi:hypothetical protein
MSDQGSLAKDIAAVCGATILLVALLLAALLLWTPAPAREQPQPTVRTADESAAPAGQSYYF